MSKKSKLFFSGSAMVLAAALIVGCGSNGGTTVTSQPSPQYGTVVAFGADAPICDVESFIATITSANLVPQGGGTAVPLVNASAPATIDFARLTDFTNILATSSSVPVG